MTYREILTEAIKQCNFKPKEIIVSTWDSDKKIGNSIEGVNIKYSSFVDRDIFYIKS